MDFELTPTIVNVAVFGVILLSAIFAYARGVTMRAIDKGLGFLFGAARGLLILAVMWIGYQQLVEPEYSSDAIDASKGGQLVQDSAAYLTDFIPTEMPPFLTDAYEDFMGREVGDVSPNPAPAPLPDTGTTNG